MANRGRITRPRPFGVSSGEQIYNRILHRGHRPSIPFMPCRLCRTRGRELSTTRARGVNPSTVADKDHEREETPLETGSRFQIDTSRLRKKREPVCFNNYNGLACGKQTGSHFSPLYARGNRFSTAIAKERAIGSGKPRRNPPVKLNQKTDCQHGNDTEVCPSGTT